MADVVKLVGDLTRLSVELESSTAQHEKLKAKGAPKDKLAQASASIAETQALYDAVYAQIPADVAAEAVGHIAKLREAQAALEATVANLTAAFPPPVDVSVAEASGAAHDATVRIEEN